VHAAADASTVSVHEDGAAVELRRWFGGADPSARDSA
jgi:hypothetical protein